MPRDAPLTLQDRVTRADKIVAARAVGVSWECIAAETGLSVRQAQRISRGGTAVRVMPSSEPDPLDICVDVIEQYDAAIDELVQLSRTTKHDGTRLGAIRARVDVLTARTELQIALGLLPHDLNDLRHRVEAREVAGLLLEVFERNAIGADVLDQVLEALEGPRSETHLLPASS